MPRFARRQSRRIFGKIWRNVGVGFHRVRVSSDSNRVSVIVAFSDDVSSFATQAAASFSVAVLSLIAAIVLDGLALAGEDVSPVWNIVSILFCASPQYGFARLFYNLSRREHAIARFEENNEGDAGEDEDVGFSIVLPDTKSFLEWENSGRELLLMFVFGFFYWFVFIILEWRAAKRIENAFEKDHERR